MENRYIRRFALPERMYTASAPVVLAAGVVLEDTRIPRLVAQLKWKSIDEKPLTALTVSVQCPQGNGGSGPDPVYVFRSAHHPGPDLWRVQRHCPAPVQRAAHGCPGAVRRICRWNGLDSTGGRGLGPAARLHISRQNCGGPGAVGSERRAAQKPLRLLERTGPVVLFLRRRKP